MKSILAFPNSNGSILIQSADEDKSTVVGTSKIDDAIQKVSDSLSVKFGILSDVTDAVSHALKRSDKAFTNVEVEFGLAFTAKGNIFVVEAEGEATLKVKLVFDPQKLSK